jgi:luciferase family oxidoreductase group 1
VLDLSPIASGSSAGQALRNSLDLVVRAEAWGFTRHWVAEHHNMPGIASSAPPVLVGALADATSTIRVGSGGVMLPNHAPLVVAEQFGMLEALHPGRIDLGLGRAPGTDQGTARALRRSATALSDDDFPRQLGELLGFFHGSFPEDHPYRDIHAVPGEGDVPELWLLGSSGFSAQVAGILGLPFAFAHHFSAANTLPALELYRSRFQPSAVLAEPYVMLGVNVLCAESDERARWLHGSSELSMVRLRSGRPQPFPTPEEAAAREYTGPERALLATMDRAPVVGGPATVAAGLGELLDRTGADELMVTTVTHDHAERVCSYDLLAGMWGLDARRSTAVARTG